MSVPARLHMMRRGSFSRHGPQAESRVSRRELVFRDHADRQRFVETIGEACAWQDALPKGPIEPAAGKDNYPWPSELKNPGPKDRKQNRTQP